MDRGNKRGNIVLMDALKLGTFLKEGKNQKILLCLAGEAHITETFNRHKAVEDFLVVVFYEQIKEKKYSLSTWQYFDVKIEYTDITPEEFNEKMQHYSEDLTNLFAESDALEKEIQQQLEGLRYA